MMWIYVDLVGITKEIRESVGVEGKTLVSRLDHMGEPMDPRVNSLLSMVPNAYYWVARSE